MKSSKKLLFKIVLIISLMPSLGQATDQFQYQIGAGYSETDFDGGTEQTALLRLFQLYTTPVSYDDGPHAEAGFLHRQPSLVLSYGQLDVDLGQSSLDPDGAIYAVGFQYAKQSTPFTFVALYGEFEVDGSSFGITQKASNEILMFQLGYYLTGRSALGLRYSQSDDEQKLNNITLSKVETDTLGVEYKNVLFLDNNRFLNINVFAEYIDDDADMQNSELGVEADYYFDRSVSIGAGFALNSGDNTSDEGKTYLVQVNAFISPKTSVGFEYEKFTGDEAGNDDKTVRLDISVRF